MSSCHPERSVALRQAQDKLREGSLGMTPHLLKWYYQPERFFALLRMTEHFSAVTNPIETRAETDEVSGGNSTIHPFCRIFSTESN
jgi:hypothetical protein